MRGKPKRLAGETSAAFRLRVIEWLIRRNPGISYDEIAFRITKDFAGQCAASKESVCRSVRVLEHRGLVHGEFAQDDNRRVEWTLVKK